MSSSHWQNIQDEDEDDEEDFKPEADREALVFLIDASPVMLQPAPHTVGGEGGDDPLRKAKSYLDVAVDCAHSVFRGRIMSAPSDKQGVVFFGTREKRGLDDANGGFNIRDGVFVEHRMSVPSARRIQDLVDLCGEEGNARFDTTIGSSTDASLFYDGLLKGHHVAREMLNDHAPGARVSKRMLIFTNRDAPLKDGEDGRELISQWKEFSNVHHIDVTVFPLQRALDQSEESLFSHSRHRGQSQREFDASVFYHNLLTCAGDEDDASSSGRGGGGGGRRACSSGNAPAPRGTARGARDNDGGRVPGRRCGWVGYPGPQGVQLVPAGVRAWAVA
mmetsp:Transcript_26603/g.66644  ORF Transcript_26603/g.66644 Transcript_26603/m.66644 type:complete len:333 (-) Transcript_26603:893-1891(-)